MQVIHPRCAALDLGKDVLAAAVRLQDGAEVRRGHPAPPRNTSAVRSPTGLGFEEIAPSVNGPQEARLLRVLLQFPAQLPYVHVHGPRLGRRAVSPDGTQQLVAKDDAPAIPDQMTEHLKFAPRELDGPTRPRDAVAVEIHAHVSELKDAGIGSTVLHDGHEAPDCRFDRVARSSLRRGQCGLGRE